MCPMITRFGCLFLRNLKCSELNSFLSKVLVTLLEEQVLSSDVLHPSGQFCFADSQLVKPFKNLTQLSRSLLKSFGFKCNRLLFKCFLWLVVVPLIKGISLLSHNSFKKLFTSITLLFQMLPSSLLAFTSSAKDTIDSAIDFACSLDGASFVLI